MYIILNTLCLCKLQKICFGARKLKMAPVKSIEYREYFYCVDRVHGDWCAACCKAHVNPASESACLTANNIWNEGK